MSERDTLSARAAADRTENVLAMLAVLCFISAGYVFWGWGGVFSVVGFFSMVAAYAVNLHKRRDGVAN